MNLNDGVIEGIRALDVPGLLGAAPPRGRARAPRPAYLFDDFARPLDGPPPASDAGRTGLMPKRTDISSILLIGSGPIVIGQACEFDYSGTQACRVLREEGYRVILANSNPATIMTDPDFADATYVEPLDVEILTKIIEKERPDALLPTLGGQTALNLAMELVEAGVLDRYDVELIGADAEAIATAEDRERFKEAMIGIGLEVPSSGTAAPPAELRQGPPEGRAGRGGHGGRPARWSTDIGLPVVIRPAYILGGKGTGIAVHARGVRAGGRATASTPAPSPRSSSRRASRAGRSTSSRSCATTPTTA